MSADLIARLRATRVESFGWKSGETQPSSIEIEAAARIEELEARVAEMEAVGKALATINSPVEVRAVADEAIERVIQEVAELPDRDSPEDWPEAMLVTADELRDILDDCLMPTAQPAAPTASVIVGPSEAKILELAEQANLGYVHGNGFSGYLAHEQYVTKFAELLTAEIERIAGLVVPAEPKDK